MIFLRGSLENTIRVRQDDLQPPSCIVVEPFCYEKLKIEFNVHVYETLMMFFILSPCLRFSLKKKKQQTNINFFSCGKRGRDIYLLFMVDPVGTENNHKVWIKFKLKQS